MPFHFNGEGPNSGDHKGAEAISTALINLFEVTGGSQALDIKSVFADDHHGVVVLRETATRTDGTKLDVNESHVLAFDDEGRITDLWDLPDDPEAHDRFFDGRQARRSIARSIEFPNICVLRSSTSPYSSTVTSFDTAGNGISSGAP